MAYIWEYPPRATPHVFFYFTNISVFRTGNLYLLNEVLEKEQVRTDGVIRIGGVLLIPVGYNLSHEIKANQVMEYWNECSFFPGIFHSMRCLSDPGETQNHNLQEFIQESVSTRMLNSYAARVRDASR